MQKFLKAVLLCSITLFLNSSLFSQSSDLFTVRIGNFVSPQPTDFDDLRPIGFLFADSLATELYQISMGVYSQRATAESVEALVKQRGFPGANVEKLPAKNGSEQPVIQLAALDATKPIKWAEIYKAYSKISVNLKDDRLVIYATGFENKAAATAALPKVKKAGFSGAFPKIVSSSEFLNVSEFETGGIKIPKPSVPEPELTPEPVETPAPKTVAPPSVEIITPAPAPTPEISKPVVPKNTPSKSVALPSRRVAYPKIDGKIKRNSAIELQRVLKAEKIYSGSLDGFYGPGTTKGFENFKSKNRQWKKYVLLSDLWKSGGDEENVNALQRAIYDTYETPSKSNTVFEDSSAPLAAAYRAFNEFRESGPSQSVNDKMNYAIQQLYPSKKLNNRKPFDYSATYSYQDNEQLILHIKYLHMASENNLTIPCWFFDAYPKESAKVFSKSSKYIKMQDCTGVSNWEEVRVLKTLVSDISFGADKRKLEAAAVKKSQLLLTASNLPKSKKNEIEKWNSILMGNLSGWATRDPMHGELVTTFKVAYFQTQVRLESYYIQNGIRPDEARFLALSVLNTLIGEQMARFTN